jgi:hypothetical protein
VFSVHCLGQDYSQRFRVSLAHLVQIKI